MKETIKIIWELIKLGKAIFKEIRKGKNVKKKKEYLEKLRDRGDIWDVLKP